MPELSEPFADALEEPVIRPAWFIYCDFLGDPLRVTTAGYEVEFGEEDDPDVSEQTFSAIDPTVIDVGPVVHRSGGSETVTVTLSGLLGVDQDVLEAMSSPANYQGRVLRLWMGVRDADGEFAGAVAAYYTGYMMAPEFLPSPEMQTIRLTVENYTALLTAPSNRSWLGQSAFDPDDISAAATLGAANGARTGPGAGVGAGAGDLIPGPRLYDTMNVNLN